MRTAPLLLIAALTACNALTDTLLTELTLEERVEVCEGLEIPRKTVDCGGRQVQTGLEADACARDTLERAPVNPACAATVGEYRACLLDLYDDPCVGHASCDVVQGCFAAGSE